MSTIESPIAALERATGSTWSAITTAAAVAAAKRSKLVSDIAASKLVPPDSTFVMFGS
jgi:hypothetical protein